MAGKKGFGFIRMTLTGLLGSVAFAAAARMTSPFGIAAANAQPADFAAQAEAIVRTAYPADGPGAAIIVTRGGRTVYSAGRGLADLEARRPIDANTVFRLGSITKQFTAAIVLQLVAEGRISLDDPISRFFPDFPQPGGRATVRQLLNHVSGLQDYTKLPGWIRDNGGRHFTTAELVAVIRAHPTTTEPGTTWEYNNGGYVMLGAIVEQVTGKSWYEAVAERIARPLGLASIAWGGTGEAVADVARGYSEEDGGPRPVVGPDWSVPHAAGGLVGSVADLARWAQALHHGRVLRPDLYREMIRPGQLEDGTTEPYGFGLRLLQLRGRPVIVHGGAIRGFRTGSAYFPAEDLFVAVFANSDDPATTPSLVVRRLAAAALGEPFPDLTRAEIDVASLEPLFGVYSAEEGPPRRFFTRDGMLYIGRGDEELELTPAGDDRFFRPGELTWLRFVRPANGPARLEVHHAETRAPEIAVRTGPLPAEAAPLVGEAVLRTYVGSYATEGPPVTIALNPAGRLTVQVADRPPLLMRAVSDTEFRVDEVGAGVTFHAENGRVERLTIRRGPRTLEGRRTGG